MSRTTREIPNSVEAEAGDKVGGIGNQVAASAEVGAHGQRDVALLGISLVVRTSSQT